MPLRVWNLIKIADKLLPNSQLWNVNPGCDKPDGKQSKGK